MSEFYNMLRKLRESRGLTQREVAEHLGLSPASYSLYEKGMREPRYDMLEKMAAYFGVSIDYLMTGNVDEPQGEYYLNEETAKVAQAIFENKELRTLFDAARNASPEDLEAMHTMLLALKRKERGQQDEGC